MPKASKVNRGKTNALERAISRGGDLTPVIPVTAPSAPAGEMPVDAAQGNGRRGNDAGGIQAAHWKFAEHVAGIFGKQVIPVVADGDFRINGVMHSGNKTDIFIDVRTDTLAHIVMGQPMVDAADDFLQLRPDEYSELETPWLFVTDGWCDAADI